MFVDLPWENSWATVVNQAANCLWELLELLLLLLLLLLPPEWQLLHFSWLDKYKLWEFNSHQRLVLVRIYIHTHTADIHFYRVCFCLCLWQLFVAFSISRNFALICLSSSAIFVFCCFLFDALSKVRNSFISNAT